MLEVKNLTVSAGSRLMLSDLNLAVQDGEVAALMGPNGSGKSTLSYVVAGRKDFTVESGEILLNGENILDDEPNVRAAKGLFLAFQYPIEIPGVAALTFLKSAMNSQRKHRGEAELSTPDFMKRAKASASKLGITQDMLRRALNVGFSGGEKKRTDILQMTLLEPTLVILDETDSGYAHRRRWHQCKAISCARYSHYYPLPAASRPCDSRYSPAQRGKGIGP